MSLTKFIEECKSRLKASTPGPWRIGHVSEIADGEFSAEIDGPNGEQIAASYLRKNESIIASAPTDIAKLLAIVECLYNSIAEAPHGRTCSIYDGHPCDCVRKSLREAEEIVSSKT